MDKSQTGVNQEPGHDRPAESEDHTDQSSGGYYYDDTTGYEIYDDRHDQSDEEEDRSDS